MFSPSSPSDERAGFVPSSRTPYEGRHGGRGRVLRACDRVLSVARRNPCRDRREDRSARRPDRNAPDATRSRRNRGHRDEELCSRRRGVPRSRAPDAVLRPVVEPRWLHLPPATQAVAIEPGGVRSRSSRGSRRRPRGARGALGRSRPSKNGVRVSWDRQATRGSSVRLSRA